MLAILAGIEEKAPLHFSEIWTNIILKGGPAIKWKRFITNY